MSVFTAAGVSRSNGKVKVRFCSDTVLRIKNLQKQGDTDINIIDLPHPMNKVEICTYLLAHPSFQSYNTYIAEILESKKSVNKLNLVGAVTQPLQVDREIEELRELAEA